MASTDNVTATPFPSEKPQPTPTHNAIYHLPTIENVTERDRLDFQHTALSLALGSIYAAPDLVKARLASGTGPKPMVLDIGTGSGIWAKSMAREFPNAEVIGVDLTLVPSDSNTPPNCKFEYRDANDGFPDFAGQFDVVHARSVNGGIRDQDQFVRDLARILKPGGVLLWSVGDMFLHTENYERLPCVEEGQEGWCAMHTIFTQIQEEMIKQGRDINIINEFQPMLKKSEFFTHSGQKDVYCPVGAWKEDTPETPWKRVGELFALNTGRIVEFLANLLVQAGRDKETIDRWLTVVKEELQTCNPKTQAMFRHVWAVRNDVEWTPAAADAAKAD
ncbi:hypothetical protein FRC04_004648 [Tulasnella sp. 424]|nr:hypothetical protein FRC04_004648 [Tulasnella sp. 424]KAG8963951.1 hypothetical protein FRC05_004353 [Tulasnella sp. 425]